MADEQAVARFVSDVSSEPVGEPEAHVSQAIITLMNSVGITVASQVREETHPVIPDFAIMNGQGLISGYIEVKQPAVDIAPDSWPATTHNGKQWRYLRQLDSVFYTNGLEWVLYQRGMESGRWRVGCSWFAACVHCGALPVAICSGGIGDVSGDWEAYGCGAEWCA